MVTHPVVFEWARRHGVARWPRGGDGGHGWTTMGGRGGGGGWNGKGGVCRQPGDRRDGQCCDGFPPCSGVRGWGSSSVSVPSCLWWGRWVGGCAKGSGVCVCMVQDEEGVYERMVVDRTARERESLCVCVTVPGQRSVVCGRGGGVHGNVNGQARVRSAVDAETRQCTKAHCRCHTAAAAAAARCSVLLRALLV